MSNSLNKIIQGALKGTTLKKIRFKRDPGNVEAAESYEGYLLEEDGISNTATIFVPELLDSLLSVGMDSIEEVQPEINATICSLKASAVCILSDLGHVTCELDIRKIEDISSIEQLEFYLNQFDLSDLDILNIYRGSFTNEKI